MLKLFLWLRYLRKKKIVFLSIAAVALSVALMTVVDSLFIGYIKALRKSIVAGVGDIFLWGGAAIPKYDVFLKELEELEEVEAAATFLLGGGLLHLESGDVREVWIKGIDPSREAKFMDWKQALLRQKTKEGPVGFEVPGHPDDDGAWLGVVIAAEPNEKTDRYNWRQIEELIGKRVVLTTTALVGGSSGEGGASRKKRIKRKVVKLRVSDIAFTQTYFGDKVLYLPFQQWHKLQFGDGEAEHTRNIKIKLKKGIAPASMKEAIRKKWEQFARQQLGWDAGDIARMAITTEQEAHSNWFGELRKQLAVLLLIFGVICSVSVLLIFCIFYMIVETKQKDIAIIKSCGAASGSAAWIFIGFGVCVGVVGSVFGTIIGYVVTRNINILEEGVRVVFGMKLWQSSSYMLETIPNEVNWPAVWPIVLVAVASCIIGALIPAIVASRVEPVKILRYE